MTVQKIKLPLSAFEKVLQALCMVALLWMFADVVFSWGSLPATIVTHFGTSGKPDGWGGKEILLALPVMTLLMSAGLTLLERFPQISNFPGKVTKENAPRLYRTVREMVTELKLATILTLGYIEYRMIQGAVGKGMSLGALFLPVLLGACAVILAVFLVRIFRAGK
jgi:hypothetical protein